MSPGLSLRANPFFWGDIVRSHAREARERRRRNEMEVWRAYSRYTIENLEKCASPVDRPPEYSLVLPSLL